MSRAAKVEAPEQEVPAGPVPDAGSRPYHQQVKEQAGLADPVAAQGDIEILPKPGAQRDVPAPPEFSDGPGDIGIVEVAQEIKAQHPPQAHSHIGIAREVKIELEGEGQDAQPSPCRGELRCGHGLVGVPEHAEIIGQKDLFRQTHHKDLHTGGKLLRGVGAVLQLIVQVLVLDDGTGDELREEGDKGAEGNDVLLAPGVPSVDVDGIAHGLEGVEGDADGQADIQHRHEAQTDGGERFGQEVPILEEEQQGQIEEYRGGHRRPCAPVVSSLLTAGDEYAVGVIDGDGGEHDEDILGLSPAVKNEVEEEQYGISPFQWCDIIS